MSALLLPLDEFSASSLQDFADCRRRFQLRYLQHLAWPAIESEPALENELFIQLGQRLHRLVQQYFSGVSPQRLEPGMGEPDLHKWWSAFLAWVAEERLEAEMGAARLIPELGISAALPGEFTSQGRLVAKLDLVNLRNGRVVIYDWKTGRSRPRREQLARRLQTRIYPYLLVRSGAFLNGGEALQPEQVEMVYWFASDTGHPERFSYSQAAYQADEGYLDALLAEVARAGDSGYPRVDSEKPCQFCVYRSLCARGVAAGGMEDWEEEQQALSLPDLDFDQIGEIRY